MLTTLGILTIQGTSKTTTIQNYDPLQQYTMNVYVFDDFLLVLKSQQVSRKSKTYDNAVFKLIQEVGRSSRHLKLEVGVINLSFWRPRLREIAPKSRRGIDFSSLNFRIQKA